MRRRKVQDEAENHERWLVSYADFVTLLFALFVVLFASSQSDALRAHAVTRSLNEAFEANGSMRDLKEIFKNKPESPAPKIADKSAADLNLEHSLEILQKDLKEEIGAGAIRLSLSSRGLTISMQQAAFFPSGGAQLPESANGALAKIARVVNLLPNQLRLEGHTDTVPISTERYRNNWELSCARGIAVLEMLQQNYGVKRDRMAVVAYGDTVAVADNLSEEGRARNRRVDLTLLRDAAQAQEPETKASTQTK